MFPCHRAENITEHLPIETVWAFERKAPAALEQAEKAQAAKVAIKTEGGESSLKKKTLEVLGIEVTLELLRRALLSLYFCAYSPLPVVCFISLHRWSSWWLQDNPTLVKAGLEVRQVDQHLHLFFHPTNQISSMG
jgi:hypothetical protein